MRERESSNAHWYGGHVDSVGIFIIYLLWSCYSMFEKKPRMLKFVYFSEEFLLTLPPDVKEDIPPQPGDITCHEVL